VRSSSSREYFCNEPWLGLLAIETDLDATFCPCYLKLRLGNLRERSLEELWNAAPLVEIRASFQRGQLPAACRGQLCAPVLGTQSYLTERPVAAS
jgi:MoaA/NifB/PqqE/SkfB family radical SAM enzyme